MCNHEVAQGEAREALRDLGRHDRPSVVMVSMILVYHQHRPWPWPGAPCASPAAGSERLLPQKETFGPIKWQLSKLQENAAQLRGL